MNFFSVRTNDQNTIGQILDMSTMVTFDRLSWHKDEISIDDIIFIVISGDNSKKVRPYTNGLRAIGRVVKLPQDEEDKKNFKLGVEIFEFLSKTLTKDDFYVYPSLKDAPNIGPDTKSIANQSFRKITSTVGQSIFLAIYDILGDDFNISKYDFLIEGNSRIEKLKNDNEFTKLEVVDNNFVQDSFAEWFNDPINFRKSYDGLVTTKVLNFWNENYFDGHLFNIDPKNPEHSVNEIEKLIYLKSDKKNYEWKTFSYATNRGAPEAVLGKNNYIKFLREFISQESNLKKISNFKLNKNEISNISGNELSYDAFHKKTKESNLNFSSSLILRFIASLTSKPFVILSGLSGSGKTKIAQTFAQWICEDINQHKIVPVGADWTNREPLLGYPNGLVSKEYITPDSGVIHLLLEAIKKENENKPFFLILDEMNLSHVERYFADFLSIMESNDTIKLYTGNTRESLDGLPIPLEIYWPKNLFIIGTVNIDETTYMFSPKVLDRANVIEFRITDDEIKDFLASPSIPDLQKLKGQGIAMAESFLSIASRNSIIENDTIAQELVLFFKQLQPVCAEFGYRSATEILQLVTKLKTLEPTITDNDCLDVAITQKLLPKLHGSRSKLVKILITLSSLCLDDISKEDFEKKFDDFYKNNFEGISIKYPISFEKLIRMYKNVLANGFTSYAEA
jgi:5-methylcytosine-specific restriction protein B